MNFLYAKLRLTLVFCPWIACANHAAAVSTTAQTTDPSIPLPAPPAVPPASETLRAICTLSTFDVQSGATLSSFCSHLEQPVDWGLLREQNITYSKRGLIDTTLLERTGGTQPAYKILLWSPDFPHEYASEEPLLVLEPQIDPGTTLDPSGPQYLRLIPGQMLVYVPLLGPQPSILYRVDLRTHALLQTSTLLICPATETCTSQQLFLMAHAGSSTRWLLHTWRFGTGDQHGTTTLFWNGRSVVEKKPPATLLGPTWVAVALADDSGRPSIREHYRVALHRPAGWVIEGCLDAEGNARPEDVFKGIVDISFPEESDRNWHAIGRPKKRSH